MVKLLDPPTPPSPRESHSHALVTDHEKRIEAELAQLLIDIRRIGPTFPPGTPHVLFGELFDDDSVQQYYEALVGTLKSAKKRGVISFKGQMLLKGMHDKVKISIVNDDDTTAGEEKEMQEDSSTTTKPPLMKSLVRKPLLEYSPLRVSPSVSPVLTTKRKSLVDDTTSTCSRSLQQQQQRSPKRKHDIDLTTFAPSISNSPILLKRKNEIAGASSDGETEVNSRRYVPPPTVSYSDSEADGSKRPRARGRITLPPVFLQTSCEEGRPPAPWRTRKAKSFAPSSGGGGGSGERKPRRATSSSSNNNNMMPPLARKKEPTTVTTTDDTVGTDKEDEKKDNVIAEKPTAQVVKPEPSCGANYGKEATSKLNAAGSPFSNTKENDGSSSVNVDRPTGTKQRSSQMLSKEASYRVDHEVHQLVKDICRVGSNPGEPSVKFGELFDDEEVQQTYEALIGTLRSAKRQGFITFKGQMLFKGMHDNVMIHVVEEKMPAPAEAVG